MIATNQIQRTESVLLIDEFKNIESYSGWWQTLLTGHKILEKE